MEFSIHSKVIWSDRCYTGTHLGRQEITCYRREQILLQERNKVCFQPGVQSHPVMAAGSWLEEISNRRTLSREKQLCVLHQLIHGATFIFSSKELKANYSTFNTKTADLDTHSLQATNAYRLCWQRTSEDNPGALCLSTKKNWEVALATAEMLWPNQ